MVKLLPLFMLSGFVADLGGTGIHFDPTISLSGVMVALTYLMAVWVAWISVPRRVAALEKSSEDKMKLLDELQKNNIVMATTMQSLAKDIERLELLVSRHILNTMDDHKR